MGFGKLEEIVMKDTTHDNESKKLMVTIRFLTVVFVAYIIGIIAFCSTSFFHLTAVILMSGLLLMFIATLVCTYFVPQSVTLYIFLLDVVLWTIYVVMFFGWDIGVQIDLLLLLVLTYFAEYGKYGKKVFFSAFYFLLYLLLYMFCQYRDCVVLLDKINCEYWKNFNIGILFVALSIVTYFFSKDSQALENKLVEYNKLLEEQANTDTLTGLYNRRKAMEYLTYQTGRQNASLGFSLCICDIDWFKRVNDNYGHDCGDEVLRSLASKLKHACKDKFFVARWGGEEFLLVFPQCNGDDAFVHLAEIQNEIRNMKVKFNEEEVSITMTFGLTEYDNNRELDYSIKEADNKLYIGKQSGRDVIIY